MNVHDIELADVLTVLPKFTPAELESLRACIDGLAQMPPPQPTKKRGRPRHVYHNYLIHRRIVIKEALRRLRDEGW